MTTHEFYDKLEQGEEAEKVLDDVFSDGFTKITKASKELQLLGIDRIMMCEESGVRESVEYKTDFVAHKTNNVFIETVSSREDDVGGWALTSVAQYLAYYIPALSQIYIVRMTSIKRNQLDWIKDYPTKAVKNIGKNGHEYTAEGIVVPIEEFEKCCSLVIDIDTD